MKKYLVVYSYKGYYYNESNNQTYDRSGIKNKIICVGHDIYTQNQIREIEDDIISDYKCSETITECYIINIIPLNS